MSLGTTFLQPQKRFSFSISLRGAQRRGNPHPRRNTWQVSSTWGKPAEAANSPKSAFIVAFPCGDADCHRCAHWFAMTCKRRVRASECKAAGREGKCVDGGSFAWYNVLAYADTPHVSACHCEERSDVAIRSPCSTASQKAVPQANTQPSTNSPKSAFTVAFPCGDADCRTSSPQSPPCRRPKVRHAQLRPKAGAGQRSLGSPFPIKRAALRGPVVMPSEGQRGSNAPLVLLSPQRVPLCGAPCTGSQ